MIEKFNFYDIYGYLLPGAALLLLFWLPIGLMQRKLPSGDWTSALLGVAIAYVAGIILQTFADKMLRSTAGTGSDGNETYDRFPSQKLLDPGGNLTDTVKTGIAAAVESSFGIKKEELAVNEIANKAQDGRRNDAFLLARHFLVAAKQASYVEQYEGMYALTRGLAAAFGLSAVYFLGWSLSFLGGDWTSAAAYTCLAAGLLIAALLTLFLIANNKSIHALEILAGAGLMVASFALGFGLGHRHNDDLSTSAVLFLFALAGFLASLRAYRFYKEFTFTFATAVWRGFYVAGKPKAAGANLPGDPS